jgi:hypothetical protein
MEIKETVELLKKMTAIETAMGGQYDVEYHVGKFLHLLDTYTAEEIANYIAIKLLSMPKKETAYD